MTHRQQNVYLAPTEPRCNPSSCDRKDSCARYLAPIPSTGAAMEDFSRAPVGLPWYRHICTHWLSAQASKPTAPTFQPRKHPPLGSA